MYAHISYPLFSRDIFFRLPYVCFFGYSQVMKIPPRNIDHFVKSPDPAARVIMIYGPDDGLMRSRAKTIGKTIVSDLNDPFNVSVFKSDDLHNDPDKLINEAATPSMMGGDRLIIIEDGKDGLTPALKTYLTNPSTQTLIIIEAGDMGARSPLRTLCEKDKAAAALPCYIADARGLSQTIRGLLSQDHFTASHDALNWLAENLAGDHGRVLSEINKLMIYMGDRKHIELNDVQAACGSGGALAMDDFVFSLAGRNAPAMLKAYNQLSQEGIPVIAMIRALQNHFRRLHITKSRMHNGDSQDSAMAKLMPKVFFKYDPAFKAQLQRWNETSLTMALEKLSDLEASAKQTGTPIDTLSAQTFLGLSKSR